MHANIYMFRKKLSPFFRQEYINQMHPSIINEGYARRRGKKSIPTGVGKSRERDEEARKFKFRRRALYITRAFIGTGEWSNMTYNRVILATGDFPLYDPVSESSYLPSPPFLRGED